MHILKKVIQIYKNWLDFVDRKTKSVDKQGLI